VFSTPSPFGNNGRVLFERRLQAGLSDGTIRVAFRRWKRAQVIPGRRYRSPIGMIEVHAVSAVTEPISPDDAHAAGYASVEDLLADLKGPPEASLYRLELRRSSDADPRSVLAADDELDPAELLELRRKLARLDAAVGRPWTLATLEAIEAQPGRRAGDLYVALGWSELHNFKLHVQRLKALGLTLSLRVGYRLSPRGESLLRAVRAGHSW
jgi:hypothetical protein